MQTALFVCGMPVGRCPTSSPSPYDPDPVHRTFTLAKTTRCVQPGTGRNHVLLSQEPSMKGCAPAVPGVLPGSRSELRAEIESMRRNGPAGGDAPRSVRLVLPRMRFRAFATRLTQVLRPIQRGMCSLSTGSWPSWTRPPPRSATASPHAIQPAPCRSPPPVDGSLRMASFCRVRLVDQSICFLRPLNPRRRGNDREPSDDCPQSGSFHQWVRSSARRSCLPPSIYHDL